MLSCTNRKTDSSSWGFCLLFSPFFPTEHKIFVQAQLLGILMGRKVMHHASARMGRHILAVCGIRVDTG